VSRPAARLGAALAALAPARALADHGVGGGAGGAGPLAVALVWGGVVFLVGMLVVAVIARLTRAPRVPPPPED
jgi:hypothetical protein